MIGTWQVKQDTRIGSCVVTLSSGASFSFAWSIRDLEQVRPCVIKHSRIAEIKDLHHTDPQPLTAKQLFTIVHIIRHMYPQMLPSVLEVLMPAKE